MQRLVAQVLAATVCLSMLVACDGGGESEGSTRRRIAVVPKGTTHVFWTAVERGAKSTEQELGVDVVWDAQLDEGDRAGQIQVVEQLLASGVDALCLAPLDSRALVPTVASARARGVPVIVFDSPLEGEAPKDFAGYVGTDNRAAGRLGAQALIDAMGGKGKVVLLRYRVGSGSTMEREEGFLEVASANPGVEVLVQDRYAGSTAAEAQTEALALLPQLREADGVFCSQESATVGMLLALRREALLGELVFVGFDSSPTLVDALRAGEIDALVVQDPARMGELAVRLAVQQLDSGSIPPSTDTGAVVATAANIAEPRIAALLE
jgi:ribose transport system substrate-binding protein